MLFGAAAQTLLQLAAGGGGDEVTVNATDNADDISVTGTSVTVNGQAIGLTNNEGIIVNAGHGDDDIDITAASGVTVEINGGQPDSGSDDLTYNAVAANAITINTGAETIAQVGQGTVSYSGIEDIRVNSNANNVTVIGSAGDDVINVTPVGTNQVLLSVDGVNTQFDITGIGTTFAVNGSGGRDVLRVLGDEGIDTITSTMDEVIVNGHQAVNAASVEEVNVLGLGGNDSINLSNYTTANVVEIYGGEGGDSITGTDRAAVGDFIDGGRGDDAVTGGTGNDSFLGGLGVDTFIWDQGDGSDTIDGGDGRDTVRFNGNTAGADAIAVSAFQNRVLLTSGGVFLDIQEVERLDIDGGNADGFADTFTVNDLFGTEVAQVDIGLGAATGDTVTVNGRTEADAGERPSETTYPLMSIHLTHSPRNSLTTHSFQCKLVPVLATGASTALGRTGRRS